MSKAKQVLDMFEGRYDKEVKKFQKDYPKVDLSVETEKGITVLDHMKDHGFKVGKEGSDLVIKTPYFDALYDYSSGKFKDFSM